MPSLETLHWIAAERRRARKHEVLDLHQRLAAMPATERLSALICSIIDQPEPRAAQQIARVISMVELMANHLGAHDRLVVALLFQAAAAELGTDGTRRWH